jgi:hypothetical protein
MQVAQQTIEQQLISLDKMTKTQLLPLGGVFLFSSSSTSITRLKRTPQYMTLKQKTPFRAFLRDLVSR